MIEAIKLRDFNEQHRIMKKSQTILFQITSLFVVGSTLALLIVFSENIVLRLQTLQTLSEEIRKGEEFYLERL